MVTTRDAHFDQILENMNKSVHKVLSNTNQLRDDLGIRKSRSKGDSLCRLLSTTRQATSSRSHGDTQLSSCTPSLSSSPQIRPSIVHTLQTSESPSVIWVSSEEDQRGQIYAPTPSTSDIIATPDDSGPETDVESDASWPCSLVSGPMMVFTEAGRVERRGRRRRELTSLPESVPEPLPDPYQGLESESSSRPANSKEKLKRSGGIEILPDFSRDLRR